MIANAMEGQEELEVKIFPEKLRFAMSSEGQLGVNQINKIRNQEDVASMLSELKGSVPSTQRTYLVLLRISLLPLIKPKTEFFSLASASLYLFNTNCCQCRAIHLFNIQI